MPTVPNYAPQEREQGLQAPGVSPAAPLEAFGGGEAAGFGIAHEARGIQDVLQKQAEDQYQKTVVGAANDGLLKLSGMETDAKVAMQSAKRQAAPAAVDKALVDFDKGYQDLTKNITDDNVKAQLARGYREHRSGLNNFGKIYALGQLQQDQQESTEARVKGEMDAVTIDPSPSRVNLAIQNQRQALVDYAHANNMSAEWLTLKTMEAESATHRQAIEQMLAHGQDLDAKDWADRNKGAIVGKDAIAVAAAVEQGSRIGEAQRQVDKMFTPRIDVDVTAGKGSYNPGVQSMEDVLKISQGIADGKVRKMVEDLARERFSDQRLAEHQKATQIYEKAARLVDAAPGKNPELVVSPADWTALPAQYRDALTNRAAKELDDSKVFLQWTDFARNPQRTAALSMADFESQFWSKMNKEHRNKARDEWERAGKAAAEAGAKLSEYKSIFTDKEMILDNLRRSQIGGITDGDSIKTIEEDNTKRKALIDWTDRVEQGFLNFYTNQKPPRMPNDLEKKEIIQRMLLGEKEVKLSRRYMPTWVEPSKPVKELSDEEVKKIDSGFDEIPVSSLETIRRKAVLFGSPLRIDAIPGDKLRATRAYYAAVLGRDDLVKSILSGKE